MNKITENNRLIINSDARIARKWTGSFYLWFRRERFLRAFNTDIPFRFFDHRLCCVTMHQRVTLSINSKQFGVSAGGKTHEHFAGRGTRRDENSRLDPERPAGIKSEVASVRFIFAHARRRTPSVSRARGLGGVRKTYDLTRERDISSHDKKAVITCRRGHVLAAFDRLVSWICAVLSLIIIRLMPAGQYASVPTASYASIPAAM